MKQEEYPDRIFLTKTPDGIIDDVWHKNLAELNDVEYTRSSIICENQYKYSKWTLNNMSLEELQGLYDKCYADYTNISKLLDDITFIMNIKKRVNYEKVTAIWNRHKSRSS